jgi:hypothetical protein
LPPKSGDEKKLGGLGQRLTRIGCYDQATGINCGCGESRTVDPRRAARSTYTKALRMKLRKQSTLLGRKRHGLATTSLKVRSRRG